MAELSETNLYQSVNQFSHQAHFFLSFDLFSIARLFFVDGSCMFTGTLTQAPHLIVVGTCNFTNLLKSQGHILCIFFL